LNASLSKELIIDGIRHGKLRNTGAEVGVPVLLVQLTDREYRSDGAPQQLERE